VWPSAQLALAEAYQLALFNQLIRGYAIHYHVAGAQSINFPVSFSYAWEGLRPQII
jgi:hypothetical protein